MSVYLAVFIACIVSVLSIIIIIPPDDKAEAIIGGIIFSVIVTFVFYLINLTGSIVIV